MNKSIFIFLFVFNLTSNVFCQTKEIKHQFSDKFTLNIYNQYKLNKEKVMFVYIDLDNCFNCSQGLRYLANDDYSDYEIYFIIAGISQKKFDSFLKEYNFKQSIKLLNLETEIGIYLYKICNQKPYSSSMVLLMDNAYHFSLFNVNQFNNILNFNVIVEGEKQINDSFYYTNLKLSTIYNDDFYLITYPKNEFIKLKLKDSIPELVTFDDIFLHNDMIKMIQYKLGDKVAKINPPDVILDNYKRYVKDQGYKKTTVINTSIFKNELYVITSFTYPLWKDEDRSIISIKSFFGIIKIDKFGNHSFYKAIDLWNFSEDSIYKDLYNEAFVVNENEIEIPLLPNLDILKKEIPISGSMIFQNSDICYRFNKENVRMDVVETNTIINNENNYLYSNKSDRKGNYFLKYFNKFYSSNKKTTLNIGYYDSLFKDSLNLNYYVSSVTRFNDSTNVLFIYVKNQPYLIKINSINAKLIGYYQLIDRKGRYLKNIKSEIFDGNYFYILTFNNSINSDELPSIHQFSIPFD